MAKKTIKNPKGAGRKSVYNEKFHPKWVKSLAVRGLTDKEIAKEFQISEVTLNNWKKTHPEFLKALKKGKEGPDRKVERSLYERAIGYSHPDTVIKVYKGQVITVPIIKHYPPSEIACFFWLKNRRPDRWRDKQEIDHNVSDDVKQIIEGIFSKKDKKLDRNR